MYSSKILNLMFALPSKTPFLSRAIPEEFNVSVNMAQVLFYQIMRIFHPFFSLLPHHFILTILILSECYIKSSFVDKTKLECKTQLLKMWKLVYYWLPQMISVSKNENSRPRIFC